jgi:hypothetical protein
MTDDSTSSPVKIDVGAKLKVELKAEVPSDSIGRLVDALVDVIRPWTEGRGFKADLIRLHREEVALKIAQRAAQRIALDTRETKPIPLKILIPLLELGSQEEVTDDQMIDMWAALLASTAKDSTVAPHFVGILSELNTRQAKLLIYITSSKGPFDWDPLMYLNAPDVQYRVEAVVAENLSNKETGLKIASFFDFPGVIHRGVVVGGVHWDDGSLLGLDYTDELETDLTVLASLGLLDPVDLRIRANERPEIKYIIVGFYTVSMLARKLLGVVMPELNTWQKFRD